MTKKGISERNIVALICAVQFINVVDFMMVMPLGPDFAKGLGIPVSQLGLIGGSYTFAGALAGIAGSFFLDKFDRRKALFISILGLAFATALGGLANSLFTLLLARVLAGLFGGPATAISLSIVADAVAPERRGRAMGVVMGSFSIASIVGVPIALELASVGGWRLPFFALGATALIVCAIGYALLPPMREHLVKIGPLVAGPHDPMLRRPEVQLMYGAVALSMLGSFLLVPNLSAYFQFNRGYPREHLSTLYFVGGSVSFIMMQFAGRAIDRLGAFKIVMASTAVLVAVLFFGFVHVPAWVPTLLIFVCFMLSMSIRGVVINSLSSRVPKANERARFNSFQSAVQHIFCALGAFASTQFLHEEPNGALIGMPTLAFITLSLSLLVPFVIKGVEKQVARKEAHAKLASAAPA